MNTHRIYSCSIATKRRHHHAYHRSIATERRHRTIRALRGAQADLDSADLDAEHEVFTPEPERVFQPFYVSGWTNAYAPSVPAMCSGAIAGFADAPVADADCLAPFQFLLERGTDKIRHGCFKCAGAFQVTPTAAPYATCDDRPICSGLSLASYQCFLKNDTTSDMFSCLMGVDFQADT